MQANEIIKQTEKHYLGIELDKSDWNSLNMQLSLENFESILRWKNLLYIISQSVLCQTKNRLKAITISQ